MASSVYKWLVIPLLAIGLSAEKPLSSIPTAGQVFQQDYDDSRIPHPFHVSVVEIEHNATDKTFEISCKIFTDDFEKVLAQNYKTKVDLINPPDKKAMDTLVKKYIQSHLSISADNKLVRFTYLGFEHESEAVYGFLQVDNLSSVKKLDITNSLMQDLFDDQVNLMHVIVGGERKSIKLDYPKKQASFSF